MFRFRLTPPSLCSLTSVDLRTIHEPQWYTLHHDHQGTIHPCSGCTFGGGGFLGWGGGGDVDRRRKSNGWWFRFCVSSLFQMDYNKEFLQAKCRRKSAYPAPHPCRCFFFFYILFYCFLLLSTFKASTLFSLSVCACFYPQPLFLFFFPVFSPVYWFSFFPCFPFDFVHVASIRCPSTLLLFSFAIPLAVTNVVDVVDYVACLRSSSFRPQFLRSISTVFFLFFCSFTRSLPVCNNAPLSSPWFLSYRDCNIPRITNDLMLLICLYPFNRYDTKNSGTCWFEADLTQNTAHMWQRTL